MFVPNRSRHRYVIDHQALLSECVGAIQQLKSDADRTSARLTELEKANQLLRSQLADRRLDVARVSIDSGVGGGASAPLLLVNRGGGGGGGGSSGSGSAVNRGRPSAASSYAKDWAEANIPVSMAPSHNR
jgi:hypothetical protein